MSALVPYKRLDVAIDACRRVGRRLRIVGTGPELPRLRALGGGDVEFLGWQSDEQIRGLYREAAATLLPGIEDFGIVPVEAQACGCPVVALDAGGARETIADGITGVLVPEATPAAFAEGLVRALGTPFDPEVIRAHALRFSRQRFLTAFRTAVDEAMSRCHRDDGQPSPASAWSTPRQEADHESAEDAARWSSPRQEADRERANDAARWSSPPQEADRENEQ